TSTPPPTSTPFPTLRPEEQRGSILDQLEFTEKSFQPTATPAIVDEKDRTLLEPNKENIRPVNTPFGGESTQPELLELIELLERVGKAEISFDQDALTALLERAEAAGIGPSEGFYYRALIEYNAGFFSNDTTLYLQALGNLDEAIAAGNEIEARFMKGEIFYDLGRLGEAEYEIDLVLKQDPYHYSGHLVKSRLLINKDELSAADKHLRQIVNWQPERADGWAILADLELILGNGQACIHYADIALDLSEAYPIAHYTKGRCLHDVGEYEAALIHYDRYIWLRPDEDAYAYFNRGLVYNLLGDVEEAIADVDRALELDSQIADIYAFRSNLQRRRGNLEAAAADANWSLALERRPAGIKAYVSSLMASESFNDADAEIAALLRSAPHDMEAHYLNTVSMIAQSRFEDANEAASTCETLAATNPTCYSRCSSFRGVIHYLEGDYEAALELFQTIEGYDWSAEYYLFFGLTYAELGETEKALAYLEYGLSLPPSQYRGIPFIEAAYGEARRLSKALESDSA
ncbi:MAG: tetratricopeptide repeat protein, partial [Chloroflexota bacterium]